jgi:hypothetical protein
MSDIYDYSGIPEFTRRWYLSEAKDHWIDLVVVESGLNYIGTDWSVQSGGGYMAGFQSFDEFFKNGSINDMPEEITKELKEHLIKHRRKGGAGLLLTHKNELSELVLWRAFVHLDDNPVKIISISEMGNQPEFVFFDGALPVGEHNIGFVFIFKKHDKQKEDDPLWKVQADFDFTIESNLKEKKVIHIITSRDSKGVIKTRWTEI